MRIAVLAILLTFPLSLAAETPPQPSANTSQVTIGLSDYEALRNASDAPSATVIDSIILGGGFRERNLTIAFLGRTTGKRPLVKVLDQLNDVTIYDCNGDGIVSRSAKGTFDLIPRHRTAANIRVSGTAREIHAPRR